MADTALYAYGVIEREDIEFDVEGVNGADHAYTVGYQTLSALVTDIDTVEPEQSDENTRAHDEVLQQLLEYDGGRTVVPMQYGMAFKNARTLKSVLREARPAFTRALREVEGNVELGLKVLTEEDADVDEEAIREEVTERFDDRANSVTSDDLFSDRLLVNRSFLVEREDREAFDRAVGEFEDDHDELLVQYTGPWAPYNFVDIEIGAKQ
ncbi:GvpL/GvpF family gas vesicle protein [Halalkalicoccus salilacus]|uniref:GvpL/GvpF family gas vesicle protein n=1 Tax=Halalkalicoccus TaxID=332246 RepID=UPI002F96A55B